MLPRQVLGWPEGAISLRLPLYKQPRWLPPPLEFLEPPLERCPWILVYWLRLVPPFCRSPAKVWITLFLCGIIQTGCRSGGHLARFGSCRIS